MKRILGINDDRDACDCCGKTGLKRVVWIEDTESGEIRCFGTTCASKNTPELFGEIKKADKEDKHLEENAWMKAHRVYKNEGGKYHSEPDPRHKSLTMRVPDDRARLVEIKTLILRELRAGAPLWKSFDHLKAN